MITDALSELTPEELEDFLRCGRGAGRGHKGTSAFSRSVPAIEGIIMHRLRFLLWLLFEATAEMLRRLCEEAGIEPAARSSSAGESSA